MMKTNKIRVLHVISTLSRGGAEMTLFKLVKSLPKEKYAICVVSITDERTIAPLFEALGVEVAIINFKGGAIRSFFALMRLIRQFKPDIVQTWMYHANLIGGIAARLCGVKRVFWGIRRANVADHHKKSTRLVAKLGARLSCILPSRIISCTKVGIDHHCAMGYSKKRFDYIPNGYDTAAFKRNEEARLAIRQRFGVGDDEIVIGLVARYMPEKRHKLLLDIVGKLCAVHANVRLFLAGDGLDEANDSIMAQSKQLGLGDKLCLFGESKDVISFYSSLDIFVLTSSVEGFPNVLPEAMLCGLPVVSTAVGDARYIVADDNWVAEVDDADRIYTLLDNLIRMSASQRIDVGDKMRAQILSEYSLAVMVERFETLYSKALS